MQNEAVVHVIDDDKAMRDSLTFLLRSAGIVPRTYESSKLFLQVASQLHEGCIITDVKMPGVDGIELLRGLKKSGVPLPIIVITGHADVSLAVLAMKIGAVEFIEKPFDDELLLSAVRSALNRQGKDHDREVKRRLILDDLLTLSPREREVLEGVITGQPNKIIAYDLGISSRTVEIYRANAMTKMKATSLSDLVRMALIAGILSEDNEFSEG